MGASHPQSMIKLLALISPARRQRAGERRFAAGMAFTIELVLSVTVVFALLLVLASL